MTKYSQSHHRYLTQPVLTDPERTVILMQMARAAYNVWAEFGGVTADYESLSVAEKERWGQAVREATRVMFGVVQEVIGESDRKERHG